MTNQEVALRRWNDRLERFFSNQARAAAAGSEKGAAGTENNSTDSDDQIVAVPLEDSERWAKFMKTNLLTR